jgi:hypothetical protein
MYPIPVPVCMGKKKKKKKPYTRTTWYVQKSCQTNIGKRTFPQVFFSPKIKKIRKDLPKKKRKKKITEAKH